MSGNTADSTTLSGFPDRIEHRYRYGRAKMGRRIRSEDSLAKMRSMGASYLLATPKGRLIKLEPSFACQPWTKVRDGVQVKRPLTEEAQSDARIDKERGMRQ